MTTLLTFSVKAKPVKEGQWCRVKRGQLKGDLVKVNFTYLYSFIFDILFLIFLIFNFINIKILYNLDC